MQLAKRQRKRTKLKERFAEQRRTTAIKHAVKHEIANTSPQHLLDFLKNKLNHLLIDSRQNCEKISTS